MFNPYTILGGVLLLIATHGATAWWFHGAGRDSVIAAQSEADDTAQKGASNDVAKAKTESVRTITKVRTVTREVPVYRDAACAHDDRVFDTLNGALSGSGSDGVPAGSGAASGPDDGGDHGQTD